MDIKYATDRMLIDELVRLCYESYNVDEKSSKYDELYAIYKEDYNELIGRGKPKDEIEKEIDDLWKEAFEKPKGLSGFQIANYRVKQQKLRARLNVATNEDYIAIKKRSDLYWNNLNKKREKQGYEPLSKHTQLKLQNDPLLKEQELSEEKMLYLIDLYNERTRIELTRKHIDIK